MKNLVLCAVCIAFAAPAYSVQYGDKSEVVVDVSGATKQASDKGDENEKTCRRTAIIGSKFTKRICATKEEWETLSQRGKDAAEDFRRRGRGVEPSN